MTSISLSLLVREGRPSPNVLGLIPRGIAGSMGISSFFFWRSEQWRQLLQLRWEKHGDFSPSDVQIVFWVCVVS